MKQYVVDQLQATDHQGIQRYLDEHFTPSGVTRLYWLDLEEALLTDCQREHHGCRPHGVAVELEPDRLVCEMLVRTRRHARCDCMGYATPAQRNWLIDRIDALLHQVGIVV